MRHIFTLLLVYTLLYHIPTYGIQVIGPSPRAMQQNQIGQALGQSLNKNFETSFRAEQHNEQQIRIEIRNLKYVFEMLRDYTPENHFEFLSCTRRSALPEDQKHFLINSFKHKYSTWQQKQK